MEEWGCTEFCKANYLTRRAEAVKLRNKARSFLSIAWAAREKLGVEKENHQSAVSPPIIQQRQDDKWKSVLQGAVLFVLAVLRLKRRAKQRSRGTKNWMQKWNVREDWRRMWMTERNIGDSRSSNGSSAEEYRVHRTGRYYHRWRFHSFRQGGQVNCRLVEIYVELDSIRQYSSRVSTCGAAAFG